MTSEKLAEQFHDAYEELAPIHPTFITDRAGATAHIVRAELVETI